MQTAGGKPIVLMGGGTTRVGDPSGKDEARQILSLDQIEANKDNLKETFARLVRFGDGKTDAVMADNADARMTAMRNRQAFCRNEKN